MLLLSECNASGSHWEVWCLLHVITNASMLQSERPNEVTIASLSASDGSVVVYQPPCAGEHGILIAPSARIEFARLPKGDKQHHTYCTLSTSSVSLPGDAEKAVEHALKAGYLHIDCADAYENHTGVGKAFKKVFSDFKGPKREDVWITTKLNNPDHDPAKVQDLLLAHSVIRRNITCNDLDAWKFNMAQSRQYWTDRMRLCDMQCVGIIQEQANQTNS